MTNTNMPPGLSVPDAAAAPPEQEATRSAAEQPAPVDPATDSQSTEGQTDAVQPTAPVAPPPAKPLLTVVQAARKAKQQLQEITGLEVATVSAMEEHEGGWRAYVNLVELRRVPSTSDVLATYEAILNAEGELETYKRLRRFLRGQVND
ncbi:MAG: gas vesicle protein [Kiloniellales bacterium]